MYIDLNWKYLTCKCYHEFNSKCKWLSPDANFLLILFSRNNLNVIYNY